MRPWIFPVQVQVSSCDQIRSKGSRAELALRFSSVQVQHVDPNLAKDKSVEAVFQFFVVQVSDLGLRRSKRKQAEVAPHSASSIYSLTLSYSLLELCPGRACQAVCLFSVSLTYSTNS